jgi:hypothetical protein
MLQPVGAVPWVQMPPPPLYLNRIRLGKSRQEVRVEHSRDLTRRGARGEARELDEVAEEDADVLMALTCRGQVEMPEAFIAPFAAPSTGRPATAGLLRYLSR